MLAHKCTTSLIAKLLIAILLVLVLPTLVSAQASGGGASGGGGTSAATGDKDDAQPGNAGQIKKNYYLRYPAAKEFSKPDFGGLDATTDPSQGPEESKGPGLVQNDASGPLQLWPEVVPGPVFSKVPTLRDTAIQKDLFKTFGYPVSDTQFQVIQRYNDNRLLEELYDPERIMWMSTAMAQIQTVAVANSTANLARNQASSAIEYDQHYLQNFTTDNGNAWNTIRNQLFIPMAVLLLLPGAVMAQVKVIIQQGSPVLGDAVNPFEGIIRSIIAIFFIPATYLVVNYGIDVSNSLGYTVASEYQRVFQSDMYHDAACTEARAFPINTVPRNAIDAPTSSSSSGAGGGSASPFNGVDNTMDITTEDPCKEWQDTGGEGHQNVQNEHQKYITAANRALVNAANAGLSGSWNVMCAFQMIYLQYLFLMGPIVAALWVWPMDTMRKALGGWVEGVVTICFWSLFWNTTVLLLACFKGVSETGVIYVSALNLLANLSVRYAFDFASLAGQMGASAGSKASQTGARSMQGGGSRGGGGQQNMGANQAGSGSKGAGAHGGGATSGDNKGAGTSPGDGSKAGKGGNMPSAPGFPIGTPNGAPLGQQQGGQLGGGPIPGGNDAKAGNTSGNPLGSNLNSSSPNAGFAHTSGTSSPISNQQAGEHPQIPMTTPLNQHGQHQGQHQGQHDAGGLSHAAAQGNIQSGSFSSAMAAAEAGLTAVAHGGTSTLPPGHLAESSVVSSGSGQHLPDAAGKTGELAQHAQALSNLHASDATHAQQLQHGAQLSNLQPAEGIVPGTTATTTSAGFGTQAVEHAASAIPTSSTSASPSLTGEAISALHPPSSTGAIHAGTDAAHPGTVVPSSAAQFAEAHPGTTAAGAPAFSEAHPGVAAPGTQAYAEAPPGTAAPATTHTAQDASHLVGGTQSAATQFAHDATNVAGGTAPGTGAHFAQEAAAAVQHAAQAAPHEIAHAPQQHQGQAPSAAEAIAFQGSSGGGGYTPAPSVGYDVPQSSSASGGGSYATYSDTSSSTYTPQAQSGGGSGSGGGYDASAAPSSSSGPLYGSASADSQTSTPAYPTHSAQEPAQAAPQSSGDNYTNYPTNSASADQGGGYPTAGGPSHDYPADSGSSYGSSSYSSGSSDSGSSGSSYSSGSSGSNYSGGASYGSGYAAGGAAAYMASSGSSAPAGPPSTGSGGGKPASGPAPSPAAGGSPPTGAASTPGHSSSGWQSSVDRMLAQSAGQGKGLTKEELEEQLKKLAELERQKNQQGGSDIA